MKKRGKKNMTIERERGEGSSEKMEKDKKQGQKRESYLDVHRAPAS